jgi:Ca2+-binding RTX toxin-like protein
MVTTPSFTDGTWQIVSTLHTAGDPNGDILWQNINDQSMVLWQQDGATTTTITDLPSLDDFQALVVGDFDGDGKADQFLRKAATGADKILLSSTGTIGNTATVANTGWDFSAAADYNGDGKDDIFSFFDSAGLLQTWEMNGTIVTDTKFIASGYGSGDQLHAVFNGAGFSTFDSLWFDDSANNYNITSYDGGVQTVTGTFTVNAGNVFVNKGDYNGDGDEDFFFRDADGSDVGSIEIVYTNEFNETARLSYEAPTFQGIRFEAGGDFDGDGIFEVLGRDAVGGETFVMNTFGGSVSSQTITGSAGNDLIDGNEGNDRVFGGDGDDIIFDSGTTSTDNDTFFGGNGNDMLDGGQQNDSLFGGDGNDLLQGGSGNDVLSGGADDDRLYAGNGTDFLYGDAGDDILWGGSFGFDHMKGGTGNDILIGVGDRTLQEGDSGDDQMFGSSSLDYMLGGSGNDFLVGGLSLDTLWGGSGNDILIGVDIAGTSGTDDTLYGGSGGDFFYLGSDDTNYYVGAGRAFVQDFSQAAGDFVMLNGTSSDYSFVDTGSNVEIRQSSDADVIAVVVDVATAAEVSQNAIYIG